ncbi:MAG: DUF1624 domain-containing protein [Bacteroidetes bacterium]|nr:DUF1624 domain-containing protein [Bacteroidota bacterium]
MEIPANTARKRVVSIDLLRGIVMVIMAIDHVRDFFHIEASTGDPTNMATTTPQLFFTRWITHFCAPVFVFLAGASAYLAGTRKTKAELSAFLIRRGIWLILVEVFIMSLAFTFNPLYNVIIFQVIWAIGISMVLLALVVRLPMKVILAIGLTIVLLHNLLDYPEMQRNGNVGFWWDLLHHGRFSMYTIFPNHFLLILYAFVPWFGVMCCGYYFGQLYEKNFSSEKRKKILIRLGISIILFFIILRAINLYGNPFPWSTQKNFVYTVLAFLNVNKYPPSLMYLCMTLGPAILSLAFLEHLQGKLVNAFVVFGRVPFFYYVVHFYYIHFLCVIAFYLSGYTSKDIIPKSTPFLFRPDNFGYSLPVMYAIWLFIIITLYPLCKWYSNYKTSHNKWWLSYI